MFISVRQMSGKAKRINLLCGHNYTKPTQDIENY